MKLKKLKPIRHKDEIADKIAKVIYSVLKKSLYEPLLEEVGDYVQNSIEDLAYAIALGKIQFNRGLFTGKFSAKLSKELKALGAKWDARQGGWRIPSSQLPIDLKLAAATSESRFKKIAESINKKLDEIIPEEISGKIKIDHLYDQSMFKMEKEFKDNVKKIIVAPEFTKEQREGFKKEYTENMKRYVTDFTKKEVTKLRELVKRQIMDGPKGKVLADLIEDRFEVSESKAKFLARQETNLLTVAYNKQRYKDSGCTQYQWRSFHDEKTRPMHLKLDGSIQNWDSPPVSEENGDKNHPGEAFNCRCVALPIVKF